MSSGFNWIPLLNLQNDFTNEDIFLWTLGVQEKEIYGIELKFGHKDPFVNHRQIIMRLNFRLL